MEWFLKKEAIFHRRLDYDYPYITHGNGIYLYDEEGKSYIDAVGGAAVVNIGHGVEEISEKIASYIKKYSYIHASQFTTRTIEEYAEKLIKIAPPGIKKVQFVSGGSEATESAIKLAYQYCQSTGKSRKSKVICRRPGYHGSTLFALSLSGKASVQNVFSGLLYDLPYIEAPVCYRCPYNLNPESCQILCAQALEDKILEEGSENIFAFIMEPVIGSAAGVAIPPNGYLRKIREICDKYDIILILDEIMCGFGRTGKWFASQNWDVSPDIVTVGKGISGGFVPLAAVFCTDEIVNSIKTKFGNFTHGFTFSNNQFTTAIGNIVYDHIVDKNLLSNVTITGDYLLSRLRLIEEDISIVGGVRGIGLFAGFDLVKNKETRLPLERSLHVAERVLQMAMRNGLNLYYSIGHADGKNGDAIIIAPPFAVTIDEIDKILDILIKVLNHIQDELRK